MENNTVNTIFGPLMVTFYLAYADCDVVCFDDEFVNLDEAKETAHEISAETNRRINIYEMWGLSEHLVESVLA